MSAGAEIEEGTPPVDSLTGLPLRRAWLEAPVDASAPYGVLLIDIDHLTTVNEANGHEAGDYALAAAAAFFGEFLAGRASLFRWAGDSFLAVLPGASKDASLAAADDLIKALSAKTFPLPERAEAVRLTVSIGVAAYPQDGASPRELAAQAVLALRECKRSGRGRAATAPGGVNALLLGEQFHLFFPPEKYMARGDLFARITDEVLYAPEDARPILSINGVMGGGKTRLLQEVARLMEESGCVVFTADCSSTTRIQPFGAVIPGVRSLCREGDLLDRVTGRLDSEQLNELSTLIPELKPLTSGAAPRAGALAERRQVLLDGFLAFLDEASADTPLALLLDNMHWADLGTLRLLDTLKGSPLLSRTAVIMTVDHTAKGGHSLEEFLERRSARGELLTISLPPLGSDEALVYIGAVVPRLEGLEALMTELVRTTSGNPLLVEETLRFLVARRFVVERDGRLVVGDLPPNVLPDSIGNAVQRRCDHLPMPVRELVGKAAVMGPSFTVESLEKLTGKSALELLELLDRAVEESIVFEDRETEGLYRFISEAARLSFYGSLSDSDRKDTHEKIGHFEEQDLADMGDSALARIAFHYEQAGNIEKSLEFVSRIARTYQEFVTPRSIEVVVGRVPDLKEWGTEAELTEAQEKEVLRALGMLRLSIRNMENLSSASPITGATLDACFSQLDKVLTAAGTISAVFSPDGVVVNGTELPVEGLKELQEVFASHRLSGAVFQPGMDRQQLEDFIVLLLSPREKILSGGGWTRVLRSRRVTSIVVNEKILVGVAEKDLFDPSKLREASAVTVRHGEPTRREEAGELSEDHLASIEQDLSSLRDSLPGHEAIGATLENIGKFLEEFRKLRTLSPRQAEPPPPAPAPAHVEIRADKVPQKEKPDEDDPWHEITQRVQRGDLVRLLAIMRSMDISFLDYLQMSPESFLKDLESSDTARVTAAAMGIWGHGEKAGRYLLPYLAHGEHPRGRKAALYLLRALVPHCDRHLLLAVMESRSSDEQGRLAEALVELGAPVVEDVMAALLNHPVPSVRRSAGRVLLKSHLDGSVKFGLLREVVKSESPEVAMDAVRALGSLGLPESVEVMAGILKRRWLRKGDEASQALEREACLALGNLGVADALQVLAEVASPGAADYLMGRRDASVRAAAAWALGRLPGDEAAAALERCLKDGDPMVRAAARLARESRSGSREALGAGAFDEQGFLEYLEGRGE